MLWLCCQCSASIAVSITCTYVHLQGSLYNWSSMLLQLPHEETNAICCIGLYAFP